MINYYSIQTALSALFANVTNVKKNLIEANDREVILDHLPLINTRLVVADVEERSIPNGYFATLRFQVDIYAYDLSSFREAAIIRDVMIKDVQTAVRSNRQFHGDVSDTRLIPTVSFGALLPEEGPGHVAKAIVEIGVEVYID